MIAGQAIPCDKPKLYSVLQAMLEADIEHSANVKDFSRLRFLRVYGTGLVQSLLDATHSSESDPTDEIDALSSLEVALRWTPEDHAAALLGHVASLLYWAALSKNVRAVRTLLNNRADANIVFTKGLREYNVPAGITPLHAAMAVGALDVARTLLDANANPGPRLEKTQFSVTPFQLAACYRGAREVSWWMDQFPTWDLERGPLRAIQCAALMGRRRASSFTIQELVARRADPRSSSIVGGPDSALLFGALNEQACVETVRLMLALGCSSNAPFQPTTLELRGMFFGARFSSRMGSRRPDARHFAEYVGSTALHFAAIRGSVDILRILLESRGDPASRNLMGHTPYELAELSFGIVPSLVGELLEWSPAASRPLPSECQCAPSCSSIPARTLEPKDEDIAQEATVTGDQEQEVNEDIDPKGIHTVKSRVVAAHRTTPKLSL